MPKTFRSFKAYGKYLLRKNPCPICEIRPKGMLEEMCSECKLKMEEQTQVVAQ